MGALLLSSSLARPELSLTLFKIFFFYFLKQSRRPFATVYKTELPIRIKTKSQYGQQHRRIEFQP